MISIFLGVLFSVFVVGAILYCLFYKPGYAVLQWGQTDWSRSPSKTTPLQ